MDERSLDEMMHGGRALDDVLEELGVSRRRMARELGIAPALVVRWGRPPDEHAGGAASADVLLALLEWVERRCVEAGIPPERRLAAMSLRSLGRRPKLRTERDRLREAVAERAAG